MIVATPAAAILAMARDRSNRSDDFTLFLPSPLRPVLLPYTGRRSFHRSVESSIFFAPLGIF